MTPTDDYLTKCHAILDTVAAQADAIATAADWFSDAILAGRMVHVFGSGHSRIPVEEMWPRYGSFPGFHPIVELSLTYHTGVVGNGGQRQAMYLENVSGFADRILRNYDLSERDAGLVISSSGCNVVPVELAEALKRAGMKVVAMVSKEHADASTSKHPRGVKLADVADLVLDTGAPKGDAMVHVPGLDTPVSPGSTIGGVALVNCIKAETAARLTAAGQPPKVLTASCLIGAEKSAALFESAYDEHAHRLAKLFEKVGE
ncbi:MAG: sugar isomerase domain-containing protein [Phycisphaera sp.]|nr:sugar isomerase domain-containing protein [Phycisphaera sp.]